MAQQIQESTQLLDNAEAGSFIDLAKKAADKSLPHEIASEIAKQHPENQAKGVINIIRDVHTAYHHALMDIVRGDENLRSKLKDYGNIAREHASGVENDSALAASRNEITQRLHAPLVELMTKYATNEVYRSSQAWQARG